MSTSAPSISNYRSEIDGLRAFAVLSVVAYHAFPNWLSGGFIGVDVFFVISGFLITSHIFEKLDNKQFSFVDFFGRRIRRLFPALILIMACSLAFGWFALLADEYAQLGKHIASGAAFITNIILVDESGYFDNANRTKPMLHLWSLAVEEQFYIIWPVVLWLAWKRSFNLLTVTIIVAALSFYINLRFVKTHPTEMFFWPVGRFWELLSGSVLAWLFLYKSELLSRLKLWADKYLVKLIYSSDVDADGSTVANVMSFFGLLLLFYGVINIHEDLAFPSNWALVPVLGAVLIIASGSQSSLNRFFLMNPIAIWFGLISYPLYLWHWPILSFMHIIEGGFSSRNARIAAVLVSILLAWLTYRFVERPIRLRSSVAQTPFVLLLMLALIGGAGFIIYKQAGVLSRIDNPFDKVEIGHNAKCLLLPETDICVLGNKTAVKEILVYGDSHALHLTAELERQLGEDYKIIVISDGSCFMGTDIKVWHGNDNRAAQCRAKIKLLENEVKGKNYEMVITSQRWHGYGFRAVEDYKNAIQDRIKNFDISTSKLIIVGSTSDVNFACQKSKVRPITFPKDCALSEAAEATIDYVNNFEKASEDFIDQASFVLPHKLVCGGERCRALWENKVVYKDTNHLSVIGSQIVVRNIVAEFER